VAYIIARAVVKPDSVPSDDEGTRYVGWQRWRLFVLYVLPLLSVFGVVIGAMSSGISTPSEAAALGAAATILLAACYRVLTWQSLVESLKGTVQVSCMVLFIIVGATAFSQILGFSGATNGFLGAVGALDLSPDMLILP